MCSCGEPVIKCHHPDNDGWYEVPDEPVICYKRAAIDAETSQQGFKPEPGQRMTAVYTRPADKPLPPFPKRK